MALVPETSAQAEISQDVRRKMDMDALRQRVTPGPNKESKLKEACEGFESVFIHQLLKEMRKTVPKDGLLHSSREDQYVAMFDEELAKTMAKNGGIGLADYMRGQIKGAEAAKKGDPVASPRAAGSFLTALSSLPRQKRDAASRNLVAAERPFAAGIPMNKGALSPSSGLAGPVAGLDGSPSQHLGQPGARYFQGADRALAAGLPGTVAAPVQGEITSEFGWRRDPFSRQRAWHSGVDIAAPEGSPVSACWDGQVVFSGRQAGYGNLVIVEHAGGWKSYYGHNSANMAAVGQRVLAGQQIASVGQTGRATGPHVHFELRRDDAAVDPLNPGGATVVTVAQAAR